MKQSINKTINQIKYVLSTFSLTFSKEEGETTEKQTRKTSVCG